MLRGQQQGWDGSLHVLFSPRLLLREAHAIHEEPGVEPTFRKAGEPHEVTDYEAMKTHYLDLLFLGEQNMIDSPYELLILFRNSPVLFLKVWTILSGDH